MNEYITLKLTNTYTNDELDSAINILESSGIEVNIDTSAIELNFDSVNMKMLEKKQTNPIIEKTVQELYKIKTFVSTNGRIVFKNYNKDVKVKNKKENNKKRLGFESFKKDYPTINNILNEEYVNKIISGDSLELLKKFPDNCIDVIITSPPYNFGIDYHNSTDTSLWTSYFDKLFLIFNECIRIIKSGGRIIVNIQPMFSDYIPSHHIISNYFIQSGMLWKGEIIWEKNNYNCKYCTWGSWKSPSSPYLKYSWEFIEVFCKNILKKEGNKANIDIDGEEFKKWVYAKWAIAPERKMKKYNHDAMFPEELVRRLVRLFSYKNDIILDPFNGVGTTTKIAYELGRKYIGIDISDEYCKTAIRRIEEIGNQL